MERGIESGSGIISSLQGVGSGNSRSLSPWKLAPCAAPILYYTETVSLVIPGTKSKYTHQALCEDPELIASHEVLLSEDVYKK